MTVLGREFQETGAERGETAMSICRLSLLYFNAITTGKIQNFKKFYTASDLLKYRAAATSRTPPTKTPRATPTDTTSNTPTHTHTHTHEFSADDI